MGFSETIKEDKNYTKLYNFIINNYAENEVFSKLDVIRRYVRKHPGDNLNGEFEYHYREIVKSLLMDGRIRRLAPSGEYVVNQKKKDTVKENKSELIK